MKRTRLLTITTVGLLIINGILVFAFLNKPKMGPPRKRPDKVIIEKLKLNDEQQIAYEALIATHQSNIRSHEHRIRELKNQLYSGLSTGIENPDQAARVMAELGNIQTLIEKEHYKHFEEIKKLCNPDQVELFNELTIDIARLFSRPPPPHER